MPSLSFYFFWLFLYVWVTTRVYKKRSTAEKYMLNLMVSNSYFVIRNVLFFVCLTNNNYVTLYLIYVFFCIVLVISRGFSISASCTRGYVCVLITLHFSLTL